MAQAMSVDPRLAEIEQLYRDRFRQFLRVAIAITGDYDQALDAVQEGFGDAIRSRERFRGDGPLASWVWRAVVNASRDVARARSNRREIDLDTDLTESTNGSGGEPSPELRAAIAALPERQRLVLFLRHYADLDYQSIAAALDVAGGTVSASLSQAHARLRRALQEVPS